MLLLSSKMISRNFCQIFAKVNSWNFHTVTLRTPIIIWVMGKIGLLKSGPAVGIILLHTSFNFLLRSKCLLLLIVFFLSKVCREMIMPKMSLSKELRSTFASSSSWQENWKFFSVKFSEEEAFLSNVPFINQSRKIFA